MKNVLLKVHAKSHDYNVMCQENILDNPDFFKNYACILCDKYFESTLSKLVNTPIFSIDADEKNKSLTTLNLIWHFFQTLNVSRKDKILIIGGGIIHDVCVLAASLYHRGLHFEYIPTTLLSMVDVCIGGKCAINLKNKKNIIGVINPARSVYIDVHFLKTLSIHHLIAGLSEAAKTAFILNHEVFNQYLKFYKQLNLTSKLAEDFQSFLHIIILSLQSKQKIIEYDETDQNIRHYLNFGHTFAHAIEAASSNKIEHGIAVAYGMMCEIQYQRMHHGTVTQHDEDLVSHIKNDLLAHLKTDQILQNTLATLNWRCFWDAFLADKKNHKDFISLITPVCSYSNDHGDIQDTHQNLPFAVESQRILCTPTFNKNIKTIFNELLIFNNKL